MVSLDMETTLEETASLYEAAALDMMASFNHFIWQPLDDVDSLDETFSPNEASSLDGAASVKEVHSLEE